MLPRRELTRAIDIRAIGARGRFVQPTPAAHGSWLSPAKFVTMTTRVETWAVPCRRRKGVRPVRDPAEPFPRRLALVLRGLCVATSVLRGSEGQRRAGHSGGRFGDPRVMALTGALCTSLVSVVGFTNKTLRGSVSSLLGGPYTQPQPTCDSSASKASSRASRNPTPTSSPRR